MCGLVGLFDRNSRRAIDEAALDRMTNRLAHRGPDGQGRFIAPGLGLGHRRLSVIDVAGSPQPMTSVDGRLTLVFNGEIYNFKALRQELAAAGQALRTEGDTEAILAGWRQWGPGVLKRLHGQFAFAIWDLAEESLTLARDRLGEKPLYYCELQGGVFAFGSELKALMAHPAFDRTIDPAAIDAYFGFGYVPDPLSIFKNAWKLPPGSLLTCRRGEPIPAPQRYWTLRMSATGPSDLEAAAEGLRDHLRRAVRSQMVADVPIGGFLSGGVDSSSVVALMAESSPEAIETLTIGFRDEAFDESRHAEAVSRHLGTSNHLSFINGEDADQIDLIAGLFDEPFADASALPCLRLAQMARRHVTVALSGDGGDELFAGYRRHRFHVAEEQVRDWVPGGVRRPLFSALAAIAPQAHWAPRPLRLRSTFQELALDSAEGYAKNICLLPDAVRGALYSDRFRREVSDHRCADLVGRLMREADSDDPLAQAQYVDLMLWLPGQMLTKVDRTSMAASLEVRTPMLDAPLVEWAAALPSKVKRRGGQGKLLLKEAMTGLLPASILDRRKQGFSPPLSQWLRGSLAGRVIGLRDSAALMDSGVFARTEIMRLADDHLADRADNSRTLWSILIFDAFLTNSQASA